ncbi:hypothetical protein LMG28688_04029 [Paraburkholderia caffeinitolerans]|uniref:Uncharacterized protein n=1 Tax=Paraburkholderia caffeinitolerans TaxID=1723730 RepID=A0A6J5GAP0_9BURK|nr:hypothetical protein LMG28688_04029 [Paraburkholderia caffeinitolerans]
MCCVDTSGSSGGKRAGFAVVDIHAVKFPTLFESALSGFAPIAGYEISNSLRCYKAETLRNPLFFKPVLDLGFVSGQRGFEIAVRMLFYLTLVSWLLRLGGGSRLRYGASCEREWRVTTESVIVARKVPRKPTEHPARQHVPKESSLRHSRDKIRVPWARAVRLARGVFTMREFRQVCRCAPSCLFFYLARTKLRQTDHRSIGTTSDHRPA